MLSGCAIRTGRATWEVFLMATRRTLTISIVVCCLFLLGLSPVVASPPEPVGEQINVFFGTPTSFEADTPFHIVHGWLLSTEELRGAGLYGFELWLDGDLVPPSYTDVNVSTDGGTMSMSRTVVFNFPEGLLDTHTFTGVWYAPCKFAVETGIYPGPCETPSQQVPIFESTLTVDFG
jgi:hypothetical protein